MRDLSVPKLLFLDLETSGLYREDLPLTDEAQPWCCSVAAMLCNEAGVTTNVFMHTVKPEGRKSKPKALAAHGLSDWALAQVGIPEPRVLGALSDMLRTTPPDAMRVVSYGDMDPMVITSLFARFAVKQNKDPALYSRLWASRRRTEFVNLMDPYATQACRIESERGYKWPTLHEATEIVLGRKPQEGYRDALEDVGMIRDLYFAFAGQGLIEPMEVADAA